MPHPSRDRGFTLLEVLVVITLLGIMMAIAVGGWSSWTKASAHSGSADEIQVVMRQAQQRAITEGRSACVWFDAAADTYSVYRGACSDSTKALVAGPVAIAGSGVSVEGPSFTHSAGTLTGATFYARGTGSPGMVELTRAGSSKVYRLSVEGLTGHVSLD